MSKQHTYVLGLNTYDHDVSACLLRDGAVAFAIAKERITRDKHASGFYKEVIDYCLEAEGITIDDVDLVVRNCYILPVPEMEERLIYQDMPGFLTAGELTERYAAQSGRPVEQVTFYVVLAAFKLAIIGLGHRALQRRAGGGASGPEPDSPKGPSLPEWALAQWRAAQ